MKASEADQRIILSRHTLAGYIAVGGTGRLDDLMRMIGEEIAILEGVAEDHPGKADKLAALVMEWIAYRERLKARMN
jgi:hypothetical protein